MANQKWLNKQIDPDALYSSIEEIFCTFGPPYGGAGNKIVPNGFFWSSLAINTLLQSREYSETPTQNECSNKEEEITQYSYLHNESTLLILGLIILSWLKINLKKKTENRHVIILVIEQPKVINRRTVQLEAISTESYTLITYPSWKILW